MGRGGMGGLGNGGRGCDNYTRCDLIPIPISEPRADTSVGERDERENGNVEMEGNDDVGAMEGHGESNGSIEDVRGGTPGGKHPNGWRRWWREDSDGILNIWMSSPREAAA